MDWPKIREGIGVVLIAIACWAGYAWMGVVIAERAFLLMSLAIVSAIGGAILLRDQLRQRVGIQLPPRLGYLFAGLVALILLVGGCLWYFSTDAQVSAYAAVVEDQEGPTGLVPIDLETGLVGDRIGSLSRFHIRALTWCSDGLFGIGSLLGEGRQYLLSIDVREGSATPLWELRDGQLEMTGLACSDKPGFYLAVNTVGVLYEIGANGEIRELYKATDGSSKRELAMKSPRHLFVSAEGGDLQEQDRNGVYLLDTYSLDFRFLGTYKGSTRPENMFNNVRAIAYDEAEDRLIGISSGADDYLIQINQETGFATVTAKLSKNLRFGGLAIRPNETGARP